MGAVPKPRRAAAVVPENDAFLGVVNSAKGMAWRERLQPGAQKLAGAISQQYGLPELLGRVLAARGVRLDEVAVVLDPTIKALLPDPASLRDMDKLAKRLADAVQANEAIAIFGDYDVDGASSSALLHRFLAHHGLDARIYIPDRLFEGYGPNAAAIEGLIKDGARLIVTVDCGTTSFEPLAVARPLGADVLVIDHHQADERLPDVHAVVNPNRQDDVSGQGHLCAAGVVFLVLVATVKELRARGVYTADFSPPNLLNDLDIVALATVCDVVPLTGVNRAFVTKGLQVMRHRENLGLKALFDVAGLDSAPTPYHLGFILGPRINAGGRIGDAALGSKLLATYDPVEAQRIAALLDDLNKQRKALETLMLEEAMAEADRVVDATPDTPIIVLGSPEWHKGLVGLVASRVVDRYKRPACVIAWETNASDPARASGTGSLRSIAGVDIGGAVRSAVGTGHLIKGGGHAMAAGLTVERAKLPALIDLLTAKLQESATKARVNAGLEIDGALTPRSVNDALMALLDKAGPYGQGNPQPRFAFPAHRVKFAKVVGNAHVRCTLEGQDGARIEAVAFRAVGQPLGDLLLASAGGMPIHIAGQVKRDSWQGREKTELLIDDAADPRRQT
jgi:single-stranded-DNA-specific exonuclease